MTRKYKIGSLLTFELGGFVPTLRAAVTQLGALPPNLAKIISLVIFLILDSDSVGAGAAVVLVAI